MLNGGEVVDALSSKANEDSIHPLSSGAVPLGQAKIDWKDNTTIHLVSTMPLIQNARSAPLLDARTSGSIPGHSASCF